MIKKVVVAAAGQGTRMLRLSQNKPKHLINVRQRPFLSYVLDDLLEAGYTKILLVVGYKEELMKEFLSGYSCLRKNKCNIKIASQYEILGPKEKEYGTACPLKCAKEFVRNDQFIFMNGDNLYSVSDLKAMNINDRFCYVAGIENEHPEKYGVLIKDRGDFLEKIIEKPKEFVGNLINTGLFKFTPDVFEKLSQIKKSSRGEYEITDVLSLLAKDKKVKIKIIKDFWKDFGNPGDVIKISKFIKDGNYKTVENRSK